MQDTRVAVRLLQSDLKEFFYFFKLKNNYRKSSIKSPGAYLFQACLKVGGIESELGLI